MPAQTSNRPHGPKGHFLIGNMLEFMRRSPYEYFTELASQYEDIVAYHIGRSTTYLVTKPEYVHDILVKYATKLNKTGSAKRIGRSLLGNGLLLSDGELWQRQRRLLQPALHMQQIQTYVSVIDDFTNRAMTQWEIGTSVNFHREMMELTRAIITKALFDAEIDGDGKIISTAIDKVIEQTQKGFKIPFDLPDWFPHPAHQARVEAVKVLDRIVKDLINDRRANISNLGDDLLSTLVAMVDDEDGSTMTDQQLRDEIMTMFVAGHETSANTLTWIIYLLAMHPEVEQRVLNEIASIAPDVPLTYETLRPLVFVDAVINEAMRLYPPAWIFSRKLLEDVQLGDYNLKAGESVVLSPLIVQRSPRNFPEPDTFKPERFLPENKDDILRGSFFPFGLGPRICIGRSFALLEIKIILAKILPQFRFEVVDAEHVEMKPSTILRPRNGLHTHILARELSNHAQHVYPE